MKRFVEGTDRGQSTLFPECLEDWIHEGNPVRVIDIFVDELDPTAESARDQLRDFFLEPCLFEQDIRNQAA